MCLGPAGLCKPDSDRRLLGRTMLTVAGRAYSEAPHYTYKKAVQSLHQKNDVLSRVDFRAAGMTRNLDAGIVGVVHQGNRSELPVRLW